MRTIFLTVIAVISATTNSWSQEPGRRPQIPIVIEADPNFDACGGNGVIEGLDPSGDGFLAVRSGPDSKYAEIDRLYNGEEVYLCTTKGKWLGVVYSNLPIPMKPPLCSEMIAPPVSGMISPPV